MFEVVRAERVRLGARDGPEQESAAGFYFYYLQATTGTTQPALAQLMSVCGQLPTAPSS